MDPALQNKAEDENQPIGDQQPHKRELTEEDEHEIWKEIALTQYENRTHYSVCPKVQLFLLLQPASRTQTHSKPVVIISNRWQARLQH